MAIQDVCTKDTDEDGTLTDKIPCNTATDREEGAGQLGMQQLFINCKNCYFSEKLHGMTFY